MLKFFLGVILGAALAIGYVRWDFALPEFFQLPDTLRGNLVSSAVENDLFDLEGEQAKRTRALEVFLRNRAKHAAKVDEEYGHPLLKALYRKRLAREARLVRAAYSGFGEALAQPAVRRALEEKYHVLDDEQLKQAMLADQVKAQEFLSRWLDKTYGELSSEQLTAKLRELSTLPE